jgi:hypothetical protein
MVSSETLRTFRAEGTRGALMRVKLTLIERDFRGTELSRREEILQGESAKSATRNHVARLIARSHRELQFASRVMLLDASEEGHKWYVRATQVNSNHWIYVYADPVEEEPPIERV